jgi:hypothetical protein
VQRECREAEQALHICYICGTSCRVPLLSPLVPLESTKDLGDLRCI